MRGRGGAGERGYLVMRREDMGDVGDLMFCTVSAGCASFPEDIDLSLSRFCFRRLLGFSLYNLTRIDLRVWVDSSDEELGSRGRLSRGRSRNTFSEISGSDSEVTASTLVSSWDLRFASFCAAFRACFREFSDVSGEPERPTAWLVDKLPFLTKKSLASFRIGVDGEN